MQQTILVIDDDESLRDTICLMLENEGFKAIQVSDGTAGLEQAQAAKPNLVMVDLRMPGMSGIDVCKQLRASGSKVPVIVLSAVKDEIDKVLLLEMGADDYVVKTASPRELLARIKALTRRRQRLAENLLITAGKLKIDPSAREAWLNNQLLPLSSFEFDLLLSLGRSAGSIRTRESLLKEVAADSMGLDRTIDVHISSLRRKMGDDVRDPEYIVTVRNVGYMLKRQS
jgi:two-component system response regulator RegX3